jgi:hypothetical protein
MLKQRLGCDTQTTYSSHEDPVSLGAAEALVIKKCPSCVYTPNCCDRILQIKGQGNCIRLYRGYMWYTYVEDVEGEHIPPSLLEVGFDKIIVAGKEQLGGEDPA